MALLWFEVAIAKADLRLTTIHREVVVIEFIKSRRTETSRIGGTEAETAWCIHQCDFGCQMVVESLVMRQSQA